MNGRCDIEQIAQATSNVTARYKVMPLQELELGSVRLQLGQLVFEWFHWGGFVESHVVWRIQGRVLAIYEAGQA